MTQLSSIKKTALLIVSLIFSLATVKTYATEFAIPQEGNNIIGGIQYANVLNGDTPGSFAERYDVGLNAIVAANPGTTERAIGSSYLKVPTAYILPNLPYQGIVVNLPEMRLYYYPPGTDSVMTFPIGIGKMGNNIPIRNTTIIRKQANPTWIPGPAVRAYNEEQGIDLPRTMGPGPDNPLGPYAIYLGIPSFLIHSTIFPESIGRRASFGCIRMNENDIKQFFPLVTPGTHVAIVNMPYKAGWFGKKLFFEAHRPLEEESGQFNATKNGAITVVQKIIPKGVMTIVDWQLVAHLAEEPDGLPHEVGMRME